MDDLKDKIKGLPHWAWGVVGIVVLVILFLLYEKSRGGTSGVPASTSGGNAQPQTVLPSASAGSGGSSTSSSTDISTYSPTTEITKTTNITDIPTTTQTTTQSYTYSGNTGIPPVNVPLFQFTNPSTGVAEGQSSTPVETVPAETTTVTQYKPPTSVTQYKPPTSSTTGMTVSELLAQIGADASAYAGNSSGGLASPYHLNAEADRAALAAAGVGTLVNNPSLGYAQLKLPNGTLI